MDTKIRLVFLLFGSLILVDQGSPSKPCIGRPLNNSIVCVCNSSYCDSLDPIIPTEASQSQVHVIESNKAGLRFHHTVIQADTDATDSFNKRVIDIEINPSDVYQEVKGFGGAFTDAAAITAASLGSETAKKIVRDFYSPSGLSFSLGRLVIGGSDFSTRKYTYNDDGNSSLDEDNYDFNLDHFSLQDEDIKFKIPLIKEAMKSSATGIKFFASAWSAPAWMKTNGDLSGRGRLKGSPGGKYYKTWAKYYVKFLQAYEEEGIRVWGLTTGNEPINGFVPGFRFNCMAFTPETQRDFLKKDLGPALREAGYFTSLNDSNSIQIMIVDDQRYTLPVYTWVVLGDSDTAQFVSGVAFHWYGNNYSPVSILDYVHKHHPNKFLFASEATVEGKPNLGNWEEGERYAIDILTDLNHWTTAWIDWNFALDLQGGPNWSKNWCDAPVIVNATSGEYYKQPMYYALGHFSKFISPGSMRIGVKTSLYTKLFLPKIRVSSFKTPEAVVTVVLNGYDSSKTVKVQNKVTGVSFTKELSARSFNTFISQN